MILKLNQELILRGRTTLNLTTEKAVQQYFMTFAHNHYLNRKYNFFGD